jgi:hypothetical protein
MTMTDKTPVEDGIRLTPAQLKARKMRNIAIGLSLGALVVIFWAMTIVRLGATVMQRPM